MMKKETKGAFVVCGMLWLSLFLGASLCIMFSSLLMVHKILFATTSLILLVFIMWFTTFIKVEVIKK